MKNLFPDKGVCLALFLSFVLFPLWAAPMLPNVIKLNWLENAPLIQSGVSWGVPWPKGEVQKTQRN